MIHHCRLIKEQQQQQQQQAVSAELWNISPVMSPVLLLFFLLLLLLLFLHDGLLQQQQQHVNDERANRAAPPLASMRLHVSFFLSSSFLPYSFPIFLTLARCTPWLHHITPADLNRAANIELNFHPEAETFIPEAKMLLLDVDVDVDVVWLAAGRLPPTAHRASITNK